MAVEPIRVIENQEMPDRFRFVVSVGEEGKTLSYEMVLEKDYWQKLTGGQDSPVSFAKKVFEFLLTKEPKELILRRFHATQVKTFYPDFEEKMKA